jgi:hypothetical protein
MFGAPVSAPFRIYYYGPFSFDLRDKPAVDWVMREPDPVSVKDARAARTALFPKREQPHGSDETLAARLHEITPHVRRFRPRRLENVGGWLAANATA